MSNDLPGNWEAGGGTSDDKQYTRNFYNPELELDAEWYWDHPDLSGQEKPHKMVVRSEDGYVEISRSYKTEEDAEEELEKVLQKAAEKVRA